MSFMRDSDGKPTTTPGFEANETNVKLVHPDGTLSECTVQPIAWLLALPRRVPRIEINNSSHCCGFKEIYGIDYGWHNPREVCAAVVESYCFFPKTGYRNGRYTYMYDMDTEGFVNRCHPYFWFASLYGDSKQYAKHICEFITANKLGDVTYTGPHANPTGSHALEMGLWVPDKQALLAWYLEERKQMDAKPAEVAQPVQPIQPVVVTPTESGYVEVRYAVTV
jgi:hypothetical protein